MPAESNPDGISTASDPIVYIPVFNFGFLIDPFNVDLLKRVSSSCNLPFERAYRYLERERIAKAVLFLYTKIVAVFPYTVGDGRKYGYYSINPAFMRVTSFILP